MNIPFKVKLLTETAKAPERVNEGDLWDIFADNFAFCITSDNEFYSYLDSLYEDLEYDNYNKIIKKDNLTIAKQEWNNELILFPRGRILVGTGIALNLPVRRTIDDWCFFDDRDRLDFEKNYGANKIQAYAVADISPRSELALKHGITVLNSPATIDNSYRKEIGIILYNAGREPYTIKKNDKIAQMLIRPLYPSSFEIVKDFEDTGRGGYGSTGN